MTTGKSRKPAGAAGFTIKAMQLPRAVREEGERIAAQAYADWERALRGRLSREQWAQLNAQRVAEVEEDLRTTWGHVLRAAVDGDGSRLAMMVTREKVPPELRDLIYGVLVAAPWGGGTGRLRGGSGGRPKRLNDVDRLGIRNAYIIEHQFIGRDRGVVLDALVHQYGVSRSTIERAVRDGAPSKPPKVLKPAKRK